MTTDVDSRSQLIALHRAAGDRARSISVQQLGSGPDVVLIAGLGADHAIWRDLAGRLATAYRVTTFDNPGTGRSSPMSDPSIAALAADVVGLLDAVGISSAHVVGSSMGGAVAQALALTAASRVRTLALIGSWARTDAYLERLLRHLTSATRPAQDPRTAALELALWEYGSVAHLDGTVDRLIDENLRRGDPAPAADVLAASALAAIDHDLRDRLPGLRVPTLVLVGTEDRVCPPRLSRELAALIPGAELHCLRDRGHLLFQEDPTAVAAKLSSFWADAASRVGQSARAAGASG